jgi:hypothetical protein
MKVIALVAFLGAAAFLAWQHNGLQWLRAENVRLVSGQAEAAQLKSDFALMENWQDVSVEISNLQAQNHELPKLRNEVRELREQQQELETLRTENARLNSLAQRANIQPSAPPPFLANLPVMSKESLTNAGFATPEATAQTYFWAVREANQKAWMNCLSPQMAQSLSEGGGSDFFSGLVKRNANVTGYMFRGNQSQGSDRVQLTVFGILDASSASVTGVNGQIQAGRIGFQLFLRRIEGDWKLEH